LTHKYTLELYKLHDNLNVKIIKADIAKWAAQESRMYDGAKKNGKAIPVTRRGGT
jgi:hypothetical protein